MAGFSVYRGKIKDNICLFRENTRWNRLAYIMRDKDDLTGP